MRKTVLLLLASSLLLPACASRNRDRWADFQPSETHVYRQVDDASLEMHVFRQPAVGVSDGPRPAVLFFHGGSWTRGGPQRFFPHAKELAARGMVALSASYRLRGTHGTGVPEAIEDAKVAYEWLQENANALGIDGERVVLAGGSAGGHLAAAIALMDPLPAIEPAALVLYNPALDTHPDDFSSFGRWLAEDTLEELFEGRYLELSPAQYVRPGTPPTAVFHGTGDDLVPIQHSRDFCDRLVAVGSACKLYEYPGAQHGSFNFGWGDHYADALKRTTSFLSDVGLIP
jgi:acetyl esterase/lipase